MCPLGTKRTAWETLGLRWDRGVVILMHQRTGSAPKGLWVPKLNKKGIQTEQTFQEQSDCARVQVLEPPLGRPTGSHCLWTVLVARSAIISRNTIRRYRLVIVGPVDRLGGDRPRLGPRAILKPKRSDVWPGSGTRLPLRWGLETCILQHGRDGDGRGGARGCVVGAALGALHGGRKEGHDVPHQMDHDRGVELQLPHEANGNPQDRPPARGEGGGKSRWWGGSRPWDGVGRANPLPTA